MLRQSCATYAPYRVGWLCQKRWGCFAPIEGTRQRSADNRRVCSRFPSRSLGIRCHETAAKTRRESLPASRGRPPVQALTATHRPTYTGQHVRPFHSKVHLGRASPAIPAHPAGAQPSAALQRLPDRSDRRGHTGWRRASRRADAVAAHSALVEKAAPLSLLARADEVIE